MSRTISFGYLPSLALVALWLAGGCGGARGTQAGGAPGGAPPGGPFAVVDSAHLVVGIAGQVRQRPTRPIENEDDIPWGPLPGATIVVEDKSNVVIGKAQSGADGRFYLQLEPGTHYLKPQPFPGKMFPHPLPSQRVYVPEGGIVNVVVEYDTGIR
jgi:hypothetical protein